MTDKTIREYSKVYQKALSFLRCRDIETKAAAPFVEKLAVAGLNLLF